MLITLRSAAGLTGFRTPAVLAIVCREIRAASVDGFRALHFSIQSNHIHLIVEADDAETMVRGMKWLNSRIAQHINTLFDRRGRVWRDRYHRRDLRTPREYRNALVYVLFNIRKHSSGAALEEALRTLDGYSSAIWLEEWDDATLVERVRERRRGEPPVVGGESWLARIGWWQHHGLLRPTEQPVLQ